MRAALINGKEAGRPRTSFPAWPDAAKGSVKGLFRKRAYRIAAEAMDTEGRR
jgi:hypothetical protein